MRKAQAVSLCCCLAALPLIGCAGEVTATAPPAPVAVAAPETPEARVYTADTATPTAILVVLPGSGALASDPALWASQGFELVTPSPEFLRFTADRDAALARFVASAQALADAPVWLVGPNTAIALALAGGAPGGPISGVVVTPGNAAAGSCTESFSYFDPGTGAPPKMTFNKSGDACPAGPMSVGSMPGAVFDNGGGLVPSAPVVTPRAPRIIEAALPPAKMSPAVRKAYVEQLAELIRHAPPG